MITVKTSKEVSDEEALEANPNSKLSEIVS